MGRCATIRPRLRRRGEMADTGDWLFVGEANAGDRAAIVYTVIESCRRRGIDPYAYLKDVLTRVPGMNNRNRPADPCEARGG
jgi:hypothetical protein